jgi:membrane-bound lytic murein transglycosylase B
MAVAGDPQVQEKIFSFFGNETSAPDIQKQILSSLKQRVKRGYRELKFLLTYLGKNRLDPLGIKGSVEGAIGIPQFMPSNIDHYGEDGDDIVDLFNHADAIASIACFLNAHKWEKARKVEKKKRFCFVITGVSIMWIRSGRSQKNSKTLYPSTINRSP